jgi:hypothetical protein
MNTIKELVKKHFNLVEATKQSFGEIKTADGELTLAYEGDELAQGLAVFVVTADGQVPAPDGEHMLEGGITIVTMDGKIEAIKETPMAEEALVGKKRKKMEEEMTPEEVAAEAVAEEVSEEISEEVAEAIAEAVEEAVAEAIEEAISEEIVSEVAEAVAESVGEMMKKMEEKMTALEAKFNSFSSAPAAKKTIPTQMASREDFGKSVNQELVDKFIAAKKRK